MTIPHIGLWFSGALALFVIWMLWDMIHKAPLDPPWADEDEE
jgi:hypothetical protein